jgi:hypothetical protein
LRSAAANKTNDSTSSRNRTGSNSSAPDEQHNRRYVKLYDVQRSFCESTAIYRGFVGGRGAGKSFIGAYDLLKRAKNGRRYLAANPTATNLNDATIPMFEKVAHDTGQLIKLTTSFGNAHGLIKTRDGGRAKVLFRSTHEFETRRGPNLSGAWLDEASIMPPGAFPVIIGCLREAGELGWCSATYTPKGRASWTFKQFQVGKPDTASFVSQTRRNPFLPRGFEEQLRRQYSARFAAQELDAISLDDSGTAVKWDDHIACEIKREQEIILWTNGLPPKQTGLKALRHELYMGMDIGRFRDKSVIFIWERIGDILWQRACLVLDGMPFQQQKEIAGRILATGFVVKCLVDQGSIGMQLAEELKLGFPHIVEGVTLTRGTQGKLAEQMGAQFEKRAVRVQEDEDLRADFQLVTVPEIINGVSVINTERDPEIGHGDRFWACALALEAAMHYYRPRVAVPRFGNFTGAR